jgi:hypothetical protein
MTSRFWTICAIPLLPIGAAAVVLVTTLFSERLAAKPEDRMIVVLAQSFRASQGSRPHTTGVPATFKRARASGTAHSPQSEVC